MKQVHFLLIILFLALSGLSCVVAAEDAKDTVCVFYFTGIGCPHCANVDPVILGDWLQEYPELVVIEYEVYQHTDNQGVFRYLAQQFNLTSLGVPNAVFGRGLSMAGDTPILSSVPPILENRENITAQYGGVFLTIERLNLDGIPGSPQIWHQDRVLIRNGNEREDEMFLKDLLVAEDLNDAVVGRSYAEIEPVAVNISGGAIPFDHAIAVKGWTLQWNGDALSPPPTTPAAPVAWYLGIGAIGAAALVASGRKG
jgi:hypothetical protein